MTRALTQLLTKKQNTAIATVLRILPKNAGLYVVGGTIRDVLLKRPTKDLDLVVTNVELKKLERFLQQHGTVKKVGARFGVLLFRPKGTAEWIDIALPRTEHALGTGGYRDFSFATDPHLPIEHDLARRDFTINAMAFDVRAETLIDPFHGQSDLRKKILKTVGNPAKRFQEDYSRLLRLVRFIVELGFTVEKKAGTEATRLMPKLNEQRKGTFIVPREVIAEQLLGTFAAHPAQALRTLERFGALAVLIPEVEHLRHCTQSKDFHSEGSVLKHTRKALERIGSAAWNKEFGKDIPLIVIIGTLLHDIGKSSCKQLTRVHGKKHISFLHHDERGAAEAVKICSRLKLSSFEGLVGEKEVGWLIRHHMIAVEHCKKAVNRVELARLCTGEQGMHLLQLIWADLGASLHPNHRPSLAAYNALRKELNTFLVFRNGMYHLPKPLVTGTDIQAWFSVPEGKAIGTLLDVVLASQLAGTIQTRAQAKTLLQKAVQKTQ